MTKFSDNTIYLPKPSSRSDNRTCDDWIGGSPSDPEWEYVSLPFLKMQQCGTCGNVSDEECPDDTLYSDADDPCCVCTSTEDCGGPPPYCYMHGHKLVPHTICVSTDTVILKIVNNPNSQYHNTLWGEVPEEVCQLTSLERIQFTSQTLYGELPDCLWDMSLKQIAITGTEHTDFYGHHWPGFPGNFPENIGYRAIVETIEKFSFEGNSMSGPIPESFCGLYVNIPYDQEYHDCTEWFANNCSPSCTSWDGSPMGPFDPEYDCVSIYSFNLRSNKFCPEDFPACGMSDYLQFWREDDIINQDCDSPVIGDINEDGLVNVADAIQFVDTYMEVSSEPDFEGFTVAAYPQHAHYDINGDGLIDVLDLVILINMIINNSRTSPAQRKQLMNKKQVVWTKRNR